MEYKFMVNKVQWIIYGCMAQVVGAMVIFKGFEISNYYGGVLVGLGSVCFYMSLEFIIKVSGVRRSDKL